MIKRSGINVSPAEVEEVLQQHPSVALAGVTGLADPSKGELIVAYLMAKPGSSIDADGDPRALPQASLALQGSGSGVRVRDLASDVDRQADAARAQDDGRGGRGDMTAVGSSSTTSMERGDARTSLPLAGRHRQPRGR